MIPTWQDALAQLQRLRLTRYDHDGEGAIPPNPTTLALAQRLVYLMHRADHPPPCRISVTVFGDIVMDWH